MKIPPSLEGGEGGDNTRLKKNITLSLSLSLPSIPLPPLPSHSVPSPLLPLSLLLPIPPSPLLPLPPSPLLPLPPSLLLSLPLLSSPSLSHRSPSSPPFPPPPHLLAGDRAQILSRRGPNDVENDVHLVQVYTATVKESARADTQEYQHQQTRETTGPI